MLLCRPIFAQSSPDDEYNQGPVFALIEENDLVVKTDRHYTQGLKLSYLQHDGHLPLWVSNFSNWLPEWGYSNRVDKFGYEIGQSIFTPSDISLRTYQPNDRPYAGWLYTGLILQKRGTDVWDIPVLENFQADLGVIGPWSLAKDAQIWVHQIRGFALPQGWGNQIKNEPGVDLKYERSWRIQFPHDGPHYFDVIPRIGLNLGNVETSGRVGAMLRFGYNIPHDFGPPIIDSITTSQGGWESATTAGRWGAYGFVGAQAREIAYTAFLDGNLFRPGPDVTKNPFVGQWFGGLVFAMRRMDVGFTYVVRTKEYVKQPDFDAFGSVFFKYRL